MTHYTPDRHDRSGDSWRSCCLFLGLILVGEFGCEKPPTDQHFGLCAPPKVGGGYTHDGFYVESPSSPPISGGTMLVTADDGTLAAADPDRDSVWLLDPKQHSVRKRVLLPERSEPGRLVEDQDGQLHVVLRSGGQLAKIDPMTGAVLMRAICPAPRGLAYDAATDNLHVACAGGELVTLKARGGSVLRTILLDWDLRDVVMRGDHLMVSRFRSAELLEIDASGTLLGRVRPPRTASYSPNTAWRLLALPDGKVLMLHQLSSDAVIKSELGGGWGTRGPTCPQWNRWPSSAVDYAVTVFNDATSGDASVGPSGRYSNAQLIVDLALSRQGQEFVFVSADDRFLSALSYRFRMSQLGPAYAYLSSPPSNENSDAPFTPYDIRITAAAYDGLGQFWVQALEPPAIYWGKLGEDVHAYLISLPTAEDRTDTGRRLFYEHTDSGFACASCHPEAGDDGHIWNLERPVPRRTQSLRGGLSATAPFHWDGEMTDLKQLMQTMFVERMGGAVLVGGEVEAISKWLDAQLALPKSPRDPVAAARGKTLFEDATIGCASCHNGPRYTNNRNEDVGTGQAFQVPSLTDLAYRAPYMHDGCAATLRDRFNPTCGGDKHGMTSQLTPVQLDDLVAYLETL